MRTLAVVITCTLLVSTVTALEPDDPALVGVWLFDEGSGDTVGDSSAHGNDAFFNGDFDWEAGKFGSAVLALGSGSIDVDDTGSIGDISDELTVAAWFRIDEDSDTGIRKQNSFLLEDQSSSEPVPDAFSFRVWTDQGITPGFYGTTELVQGEWYHVAGTYDGENVELYINGEPESPIGALDAGGADWDPLWGGAVGSNANLLQLKYGPESYTGAIDEVVILDRALAPEEIKQLLNGWANLSGGEPFLQAGDADQDLDFDQLDLVQVQIAAKYLGGQPATWGEGDWNGAPGGSQGSPPVGDGEFNQIDIIAALTAGKYLAGPYAAIAKGGSAGDAQTSIIYNALTGEVGVDAPAGTNLTSINVDSASGIFTGSAAENLGGSFDNDADNNIFKATFGSEFGGLSFGAVAQTGLSEDFVANDLTVVGSLAGGGDLGAVDLIYVPEPSSVILLSLGLLGLGLFTRSRGRS